MWGRDFTAELFVWSDLRIRCLKFYTAVFKTGAIDSSRESYAAEFQQAYSFFIYFRLYNVAKIISTR
jgi:hypothetical protein